jgi:hypothetical protein
MRLLFLVFLWTGLPALAQVSTASVIGRVQDSSAAVIANADVKLINSLTGTENDSRTSSDGRFILPGVLPGVYTLQIERSGFATTQLNGINLNVGDTKNLLIRLKIGSVSESVNVDASGLTLNSTDASVSTVVDRRFVGTIPLNGRSFQDLISMTPGIVTQNPQAAGQASGGTQGDFSVNGQRPESNSFYVDGVSANINSGLMSTHGGVASTGSSSGSTALGTTQSLVSVDALQEFRVLSSTYSAEYGRSPGGQFTFLTRSGTNVVHGSLYTYWRGSVFDASDWFTSTIYPYGSYRYFSQNNFGGTLGIPIRIPGTSYGRDKTFVFLSHEGLLLTQPTPPTYQYVPSVAVQQAAQGSQSVFSYFPYPGTSEETRDPAGRPSGLSLGGYTDPGPFPALLNSTNARLDHSFSPRFSMFFRYGNTPSYSKTLQLSSLTNSQVHTQTFTFGATAQLTSTMNNDFRLGLAGNHSSVTTRVGSFNYSDIAVSQFNRLIGFPANDSSTRASVFVHVVGAGDSAIDTENAVGSLNEWNLRNTFSLQAANHLFKFGIDQRHIASTINPAALSVQADFFTRESMLNGVASDIAITRSEPASPSLNQFSAFVQDEWRASKALTLSLGLRWEVNAPPKGPVGMEAYTAAGDIASPAGMTLAPRGTPLWRTGWFNFAPRFGAAWMISSQPDREMILRAGAGVFFDTGNQLALQSFTAAGFSSTKYFANAPLPVTAAQLDFSTPPISPATNSTVFAFPEHLQLPYSFQWDIALEKALGRNQSFTISYVGAHGVRLLQEQQQNIATLNPNFGDISFFPGGLTSNYQSLQTKFQRSISHGVQALASYTWAHSLDYGSTDPAYPLTYGNSDFDVRHNLEGALSWDLPKSHNAWLKYFLGNWGVDGRLIARTAYPVTLLGNLFSDPVTGRRYYNGVDLIPNRPLYLYGSEYPGGRKFNAGPDAANPAFSLPHGEAPGNAPRNFVRGFNAVQANIAIRREMPIYDRLTIQLRAGTFNVLNHPNFGYIDPSLSDALFGQSTKMLNQSFGPTGSLYQQGGPRSIQFSFKMIF